MNEQILPLPALQIPPLPDEDAVRRMLDELRAPDVAGITGKLMDAHDFTRYAVDAADDRDAEVFAAALLQAIAAGKRYLFRCAAGLVRVLGRVERRAPLTRAELQPGHGPGLILVGSHTKKTTDQLQHLLQAQMLLEPICFDVSGAADSAALTRERDRVLEQLEKVLAAGHTAVVYTSRRLIPGRGGSPQEDWAISARISQAIASLAAQLHARPGYIIAKGGITSSDVGVRGLGMQRAWVLGQLLPGVSVWRTGQYLAGLTGDLRQSVGEIAHTGKQLVLVDAVHNVLAVSAIRGSQKVFRSQGRMVWPFLIHSFLTSFIGSRTIKAAELRTSQFFATSSGQDALMMGSFTSSATCSMNRSMLSGNLS